MARGRISTLTFAILTNLRRVRIASPLHERRQTAGDRQQAAVALAVGNKTLVGTARP